MHHEEFDEKEIDSLNGCRSGKNAVKQALEKKVKTTGCTVHFVDKGIDTGEIIDQEKVSVSDNDNEETLTKKILKKEHILFIRVLKKLERNFYND